MNYGSLGAVIGHEILHSFDDRGKFRYTIRPEDFIQKTLLKRNYFAGRQTDKYGNLAQWWTQDVISTYEKKTQCFIDQYSNLTVHISDTNKTYTVLL